MINLIEKRVLAFFQKINCEISATPLARAKKIYLLLIYFDFQPMSINSGECRFKIPLKTFCNLPSDFSGSETSLGRFSGILGGKAS